MTRDLTLLKDAFARVARSLDSPAPTIVQCPPPKPYTWLFEVGRNDAGEIVSMLATPLLDPPA